MSLRIANALYREGYLPEAKLEYERVLRQETQALGRAAKFNLDLLRAEQEKLDRSESPLRVLFHLPVGGTGGGVHSIFQETMAMRNLGFDARIAIKQKSEKIFRDTYGSSGELPGEFLVYSDESDLIEKCLHFNVVVATIYHSVAVVQRIAEEYNHILPAYYIQDYEPLFFEAGSKPWVRAFESYNEIPGALLFAKTHWIAETVRQHHGVDVAKVLPSLDRDVYYPPQPVVEEAPKSTTKVVAMIRPQTPRRNAALTMRVLKQIKEEYRETVEIEIFGCSEDHRSFRGLVPKDFAYRNSGSLRREAVGALLREADIFLDFSEYQAFGRTALEAMACRTAVVVPSEGGVDEFAIDGENALLVNTRDEAACFQATRRLLANPNATETMKLEGLVIASRFDVQSAALSEITLFQRALEAHNRNHQLNCVAELKEASPRPARGQLLIDEDSTSTEEHPAGAQSASRTVVREFTETGFSYSKYFPGGVPANPESDRPPFLENGVDRSSWVPADWLNHSYAGSLWIDCLHEPVIRGGRIRRTWPGGHDGGQAVVNHDGTMHESSFGVWNGELMIGESFLRRSGRGYSADVGAPRRRLKGDFMLVGNVQAQFGHVILEGLSRVWGARHLPDDSKNVRYLVYEDSIPDYAVKLFSLAGIPEESIVCVGDASVSVERLFVPSPAMKTHRWITPEMTQVWQSIAAGSLLLERAQTAYPDRVYLSRSRFKERRLTNEVEIEMAFESYGYTIIHPQDLSVEEQLHIATSADFLAGPVGSQMYLGCFQRRGGQKTVLAPTNFFAKDDLLIARAAGSDVDVIFGSPVNNDAKRTARDWGVDPARIESHLARLHPSDELNSMGSTANDSRSA